MRARGFTLYELLVSLVLIGLLAGLCATLMASVRRDERIAADYADDLRHVRAACDLLASRVRCANAVEQADDGLRIDGERWAVVDGALLCDDEVTVRGVSRLTATSGPDGTWRIAVAPVPHRAGAHAPDLVTVVGPRTGVPR